MRDLNERQSQLFFLATTFLVRYESGDLQPVIDEDVAEAAAALAGTFETASRGLIYEHRPASLPAHRLATSLKSVLLEAGKNATSSFDRDAAIVLRRIEESARDVRLQDPSSRRAWLDLLGRVIRPADSAEAATVEGGERERPRLIVP